tara:strand:+ start:1564 stop:2220 length:657 start_codon:yes stop_codon:yes gene_type:complete
MNFVRGGGDDTKVKLVSNNVQQCNSLQDRTVGARNTVIGPFEVDFVMSARQMNILVSLKEFYSSDTVKSLLMPVIDQSTSVSLRSLDWLVTNYSKKHNVTCLSKYNGMFNIHQGYKTALNVNKRRNFDPFRRRTRLRVRHDGGFIESTIGQLNFMQWAEEHGVIKYLMDNLTNIDKEMNETTKQSRQRKKQGVTRRSELTKAPTARCMVYTVESKVTF